MIYGSIMAVSNYGSIMAVEGILSVSASITS